MYQAEILCWEDQYFYDYNPTYNHLGRYPLSPQVARFLPHLLSRWGNATVRATTYFHPNSTSDHICLVLTQANFFL